MSLLPGRESRAGPGREDRAGILRVVLLLSLATLVADALLPRGVAVGALYVVPVLASLWLADRRTTLLVAGGSTLLVLLGALLASEGPLWHGVANRALALFAIWVTASLGCLRSEVERALEESRLTLQTTLESIAEAVVTTDAQGRVTFLNGAAEELTGRAAGEARGRPIGELFAGGGPVATGAADELPAAGTSRVRRPDGSVREVGVSTAPVPRAGTASRSAGRVLVLRDVTEERRRAAEMEELAYRDPLTGLANRASFRDRLDLELAHARRSGRSLGLLFLDLDRFKEVNDTLGHAAGDRLLRAVAERLRGALREEDSIARLGGDEFTALLPGIAGAEDAQLVAEKVLAALDRPFDLEGREVATGASLGTALFPDDGADAEALLRHADRAMYRAKEAGSRRDRAGRARDALSPRGRAPHAPAG